MDLYCEIPKMMNLYSHGCECEAKMRGCVFLFSAQTLMSVKALKKCVQATLVSTKWAPTAVNAQQATTSTASLGPVKVCSSCVACPLAEYLFL